jgi:acyl carrier protein
MTDNSAILPILTDICREVLGYPGLVLTAETTADEVQDWDSMNHITIVVESERRFGVKFRTAEIEELRNVGDFIRLIEAKLRAS